jgi:hypothetical protein
LLGPPPSGPIASPPTSHQEMKVRPRGDTTMLRLLLFPVSVEAPHFRRSFWKTAVRKLKKGEYGARSVEISQFANERRPCASVGLRDRSSLPPPIGASPIPRRLQNLQISSAPKFLRL